MKLRRLVAIVPPDAHERLLIDEEHAAELLYPPPRSVDRLGRSPLNAPRSPGLPPSGARVSNGFEDANSTS